MNFSCKQCGTSNALGAGATLGRNAVCTKCQQDLRVCLNCLHYDRSAARECREPSAERVVEKARANFCDYFQLSTSGPAQAQDSLSESQRARMAAENLFKKS